MKKIKLFQLLGTFTDVELRALDKFLQSPYFNTSETIIQYWKCLRRYEPNYYSSKLTDEKVFKKLFPEEEYEEKKLRQLRSRLLKLVEDFLAIEQFKKEKFAYKKRIADAYLEKEIKEEAEKGYRKLIKGLGSEAYMTPLDWHRKMQLSHQLYFNHLHVKDATYPKDLLACTEALGSYYEQQRLFYTAEWIALKQMYQHSLPEMVVDILNEIKVSSVVQKRGVLNKLSYNIIRLFLLNGTVAEQLFYTIQQELTVHFSGIDKVEKVRILKQLINFCIAKQKEGKFWWKEMFELYQLGLSDDSLLHNGKMGNATFQNIVSTACGNRENAWAEQFINNYQDLLFEQNKEAYLHMAKAYVIFNKEEFINCLDLLSRINTKHIINLEILRKGLQVRAAFECFLVDKTFEITLNSHINSYSRYLNRKSILSESKKNAFLNLNKIILKLIKYISQEGNKTDLLSIQEQINVMNPLPETIRQWLIKHTKKMGLSETSPISINSD